MRRILFLLTFIASIATASAQAIGEWQVYPSYWIATQSVAAGNVVYGLMNGNLLRYDTEDQSVKTYDCLHDLNDKRINYIAYSKSAKALIIVYDNCNIDIMDSEDNVLNISAMKDKTMKDKTVNNVVVVDHLAYLCTSFGLLEVDMKECTVKNTYQLDVNVKGLMKEGSNTYITDGSKVLYNTPDRNWHDKTTWQTTTAVKKETILAKEKYSKTKDIYWSCDGSDGLRGYVYDDSGTELVLTSYKIQPNSPVRDLAYRMQFVGDRLLVAGGSANYTGIKNPITAMYYEDGTWTNFDESFQVSIPNTEHFHLTSLAQDPNNPEHHFGGSFRSGLYEYRNGKFVKLYNCTNSPLQSIFPGTATQHNYNPCNGVQYDSEGNLWMLNCQTDTLVRVIRPNGKWESYYYPELKGATCADDYLFTSSGVAFVVSRRLDEGGFFAFIPFNKNKHIMHSIIVNEDGTKYDPDRYLCMKEDLDGKVWCGTNAGLFVIDNPTEIFNNDFVFNQIKLSRNDGSGLADYLLNGVEITCIAVDGANRKWIGTNSNGIYLITADGQEMVHHFMTDNSPILSNNIESIAIHPGNGTVMIGTDAGLCSYVSDATEAEDELSGDNVMAFPNPVSPDYSGPIAIRGLTMDCEVKICSSAGQLIASGYSNGGTFTWNGCNKQGKRVASGIYQVIASNSEGKKAVVCRVVVIK